MLRCIIAEDEPLAQEVIECHIQRIPQLQLVGICSNAMRAFETLHRDQVDVIFLDIKMPGINGMDFLRSLKNPPAVIFTTAYAEFAAQSYEVEAVDYLLKPVTFDRFCKSVDKLLLRNTVLPAENVRDYLFIKTDGKLVKIFHHEIRYAEARKDYLILVTEGKSFITHMTMKAMLDLLPSGLFLRVHRSYIVATTAILSVGNGWLTVGGKEIPVSEGYKKQIKAFI
jgi:DNA-binding LytR/AlgR family response regulator